MTSWVQIIIINIERLHCIASQPKKVILFVLTKDNTEVVLKTLAHLLLTSFNTFY